MSGIVGQYRIMQFGFTLFVMEQETQDYVAHPFNLYLFPMEGVGDGRSVLLDIDAASFHKQHSFDFNKWIREGLPYVHAQDEAETNAAVEARTSKILELTELDTLPGSIDTDPLEDDCPDWLLHPDFDVKDSLDCFIESQRNPKKAMETDHPSPTANDIWKTLAGLRVPIVGHNLFFDLLFLYSHFCGGLPGTLAEFKGQILSQFPE
jgi:poly(A)-specific ribonuclease